MDATRGPILFRCDGTLEAGWEPFYRCLALAAALQRRRRGTHFLSYLDRQIVSARWQEDAAPQQKSQAKR